MEKSIKLSKMFCLTGILGVVFYVLHDVIGAMNYPGYEWTTQAVSDLTATDAPSFVIARALSSIYGLMSVVCCLFVLVLSVNKNKVFKLGVLLFTIMNFISEVGYSLFPLSSSGYDGSFQSFMHVNVITTAVVLLSIVSLILLAVGSFKSKQKALGILAIIALVCMFFGAVGSQALPKTIFGIVERFSTYSAVIYTAILGVFTWRE